MSNSNLATAAVQSAEDRARDALAVALEAGPTNVTRATLATYCRTIAQDASEAAAARSGLDHSTVLGAATAALSDDDEATAALHRLLGTGGERPGLLAQRVPLGSLLGEGIPATPFLESPALGERLFYREAVWIVSGHKKSGKSWALAATALDCAKAERPVVYVDFENGHRMFAKRMLLLGADAATVDEHLHYVELPLGLSIDGLHDDLDEIADALPGAFVVIDSLRGFMARLSPPGRPLDPNAHQDIESVCAPLTYGAKRRGLTVGIIDHAKKTGSDTDEYSTAGAGAKEAAVDAVYFWTKVDNYSKEAAGLVKIAATSDREGELDFERYWRVGGQGAGPFRFDRASADEVGSIGRIRSAIFDVLADNEGTGYAVTALENMKSVKGRATDIRRAADIMAAAEPHVFRDPNPKRKGAFVYVYDSKRSKDCGALNV